jgi:hypothetical protein
MWRARFAYLEVAVVGEGGRRWWPSMLKLGRWCGGSPVYLRRRGKHQWERRTLAIHPGRLAQRGWQHRGVAAAKMVARVGARLGWGKLLGTAPYMGKLVPTTRNQRRLQSYVFCILIQSRFGWRTRGMVGFPSRQRHELSLVSVLREDDGVLAGWPGLLASHWAMRWAVWRIEKGEGKEEAEWAELRFLLGFGLLPNRNQENPFLFSNLFIICKLIWIQNKFEFWWLLLT